MRSLNVVGLVNLERTRSGFSRVYWSRSLLFKGVNAVVSKNELMLKIAEALRQQAFMDDLPEWITNVQVNEDQIGFYVNSDESPSAWQTLTIS